ncbi:MAG TPA: sugar phosphate nucleotidyltransferase [Candidatus Binatia bacterium]|jgi:UTP--glucose-1-phosphate uridylyltransferase
MDIRKAIIPAAGRGTRMGPLTRALPKEMLPLRNKPMIQWAVEEAADARISDVCVVIRKGKEIIRDFLLRTFALRKTPALTFIHQRSWDGLGGALRAARTFVGRDVFLMIVPDQFLAPKGASASGQLVARYEFDEPTVLSTLVRIPGRELEYFPGSRPFNCPRGISTRGVFAIGSVSRESGKTQNESFAIRGFGRTIFPPEIFGYLGRRFRNPQSGEIDLFKTFLEFPKRISHWGCLLTGRACDFGTLRGYRRYAAVF